MGKTARARKTVTPPPPPVQEVTVTRPAPAAWQAALDIADGNPKRLRVVDARTVLVLNQER